MNFFDDGFALHFVINRTKLTQFKVQDARENLYFLGSSYKALNFWLSDFIFLKKIVTKY